MKKNTIALITLFIGLFALAGCQEKAPTVVDLSTLTLGEILESQETYSDFFALVEAAGFTEQLKSPAPFTLFLPANGTFNKAEALALENLSDIVRSHIVSGKFDEALILAVSPATLPSLGSQTVSLTVLDQTVLANDVLVSTFDIIGTNGVIHVINGLLIA